jgi:hypothetical protein
MTKDRTRDVRGTLGLAWILVLAVLPANWCDAAERLSGQVHQASAAGVGVKVDTRWLDGGGYRPVRVTVTPTRPVVADRTLSFRFSFNYMMSRNREDVQVVEDVELPADSGPVEATISIPQMIQWQSYKIEVVENGRVIKKLTMGGSTSYDVWGSGWEDWYPRVLVVADKLPDTSNLGRMVIADDNQFQRYGISSNDETAMTTALRTAVSCSPAELPQRWLDYSNVDLLFIRLTQLKELSQTNPGAFDSMIGWTAAGGNLCVSGVGEDWQRVGELESLIGLPVSEKRKTKGAPPTGWTEPNAGRFGKAVQGLGSETLGPFDPIPPDFGRGNRSPYATGGSSVKASVQPIPKRTPAPKQAHFAYRSHEMGLIVAIRPEDPFPGTAAEWAWMLNSIGANRFLWPKRHGVTVTGLNPDFLNFLIPGVGLAPVGAFRILITLFVVAIGPLNYFLLRRRRRLHWLVVTIPVSAGVVTAALFAYALVADGLGTRARVRSVTRIDQRNQRAVCWSRISYYAGLAPSRGLTFSDDIVVVPLKRIAREVRGRRRDLIWREDQWLVSGWLNSRTPTQYLTVRSRSSQFGLDVDGTSAATGKLSVRNGLGSEIHQLLVRTKDGKYFGSSDVAPDAAAKAMPVDPVKALDQMRPLFGKAQLSLPPGVDSSNAGVYGLRSNYQRIGYYYGRNNETPTTKTGRLEATLSAVGRSIPDQGSTGLAPGSYIAIVRKSPEVELGTEATEESSLHVVVGEW